MVEKLGDSAQPGLMLSTDAIVVKAKAWLRVVMGAICTDAGFPVTNPP